MEVIVGTPEEDVLIVDADDDDGGNVMAAPNEMPLLPLIPSAPPLPFVVFSVSALAEAPGFAPICSRLAAAARETADFAAANLAFLLKGRCFCGVVSKGSARRRPKLTAAIVDFVVAAVVVFDVVVVVVVVVVVPATDFALNASLGAMETDRCLDLVPRVTDPGAG